MRSSRLDRTILDAFSTFHCHENLKLLRPCRHRHMLMPHDILFCIYLWAFLFFFPCLALGMTTFGLDSNGRFTRLSFVFPLKWLVTDNISAAAIWLLLPSPVTYQAGIPPPTPSPLSNSSNFLSWDRCLVVLWAIWHSSSSFSGIETRGFNHTLWYSLSYCGLLIFLISTDSFGSLFYFFG